MHLQGSGLTKTDNYDKILLVEIKLFKYCKLSYMQFKTKFKGSNLPLSFERKVFRGSYYVLWP